MPGRTTLALISALFAAQAWADRVWDAPFAPDTAALAAAAKEVTAPDNPPVIFLLQEQRYSVRRDHRVETTIRVVYRVMHQDAVEAWSSLEHAYQPWYQNKPQLRARVIRSDGTAASWLDPATIAEAPVHQYDSSIYSDARVVRAPLPGVESGAIVEYEIKVSDKTPLLDAGTAQRIVIDDSVPIQRFHLVIEAERGVPLKTGSFGVPETAVRKSENGGATRIVCDFGPITPPKHREYHLPFDRSSSPYFAFSTAVSWQSVAQAYGKVVSARLAAADPQPSLEPAEREGAPLAVAARLTARLHRSVRYTGVEFGEAAIVPGTPSETLKRGYGDCKDKSALLVALLRAAGLKADIALLSAGGGADVDPGLPGMGIFDHAIVYVASDPPIWIDATAAQTRTGRLPSADEGRWALVANPSTTGLVKIPESRSEDNRERHTVEVKLSEFGPGDAVEVIELDGGEPESSARALYGGEEKSAREQIESYAKQNFGAKSVGRSETTRKDDLSGPFRITVEAQKASSIITGTDDAAAALAPWLVFEGLPFELTADHEEDGDEPAGKRIQDLVFDQPFQIEYRYRIVPPPLFKPGTIPKPVEAKLGAALLTRTYRANADSSLEVVYRLDSGPRRWTAAQVNQFREAFTQHKQRTGEVLTFTPITSDYVAVGQFEKAIRLLREAVAARNSAMAKVRLSRLLLAAHLGSAALREALGATELDPQSSIAWQALAWAYQHDTFGRRMQGNWSHADAERCFRKALEIDPEDANAMSDLAILLEHNRRGWRYAQDARVTESITLYRAVLKKQQYPLIQQNLTIALLRLGQIEAAREEAGKCAEPLKALLLGVISAIADGPARAIVSVQTAFPDPAERANRLASIAATLAQIRSYETAQVVMAAAARSSNAQDLRRRAELYGKVKRWEEAAVAEDDPRWPVQRLVLNAFRQDFTIATIRPLHSGKVNFEDSESDFAALLNSVEAARRQFLAGGMQEEGIADLILSLSPLSSTGQEDRGFSVTASVPGSSPLAPVYVVREEGKYRILGGSAKGSELVGELVLELIAKNDLAGAQWWLDKVAADVSAASDGTGTPAIKGLWSGTTAELRSAKYARTAAYSLIAAGKGDRKAIESLEAGRARATNPLDRAQLDKAICEGLEMAKRWADLATAAKRLQAAAMFSEEGFRYFVKGAAGAGQWPALSAEAKKRLQNNPKNLFALRALILAAMRSGDTAAALARLDELTKAPMATTDDYTFAAWIRLLAGKVDAPALDSLKGQTDSTDKGAAFQYTLALVQAVLGHPDDAQQSLLLGLNNEEYTAITPAGWLAYARICERYGFPDDAKAALEKARSSRVGKDEVSEFARELAKLR